jgi:hypothetical protein
MQKKAAVVIVSSSSVFHKNLSELTCNDGREVLVAFIRNHEGSTVQQIIKTIMEKYDKVSTETAYCI